MFRKITSAVLHPRQSSIKVGGRRVKLRTKNGSLTPLREIRIMENANAFSNAESIAEQVGLLTALMTDMYEFPSDDPAEVDRILMQASRSEMENAANHFLVSYMTAKAQEIKDVAKLASR